MAKRLQIVNLELGISQKLQTQEIPVVSQPTQEKIANIINIAEDRKDAAVALQNKLSEKDNHIERIFKSLMDSGSNGMLIDDVIKGYEGNIISLTVRLNNLIKKRGNLWKLKKTHKEGKIRYYLKTT
jgi:hypothetical protein